ncbi:MAG: tetratricopeptide repeat protein, partial [Firmicutes bacterium]|nr:tetratricopeptide repeat protein [Bacillota bacterium]
MINKIRYKKTYFCFLSSAFCFFLLLTVGCKSTNNNEDKQQVEGDSTSINLQASALPQSWDSKLDSLLYESTIAIPDTNLAKLYISIGNMYHGNNFKKAEEYYLKADSLSEKLTWNKGSFQSCQHLGNLMLRQGLYDSAIVVTKKGFDFAEKENNELMFGSVYTNLGNCYRRKEWYETALENYKNAIQIFEKNDDIWKLAQVYDAMGTTYRSLSLMDEGIKYGEKALAILNKKPDTLTRAAALINLGSSYHLKNMDDEAEKYFREALRISKIYNNKNNL